MERRVNSKGERCEVNGSFFSSRRLLQSLFADVLSGSKPPVLIRKNEIHALLKVLKQVRGLGPLPKGRGDLRKDTQLSYPE